MPNNTNDPQIALGEHDSGYKTSKTEVFYPSNNGLVHIPTYEVQIYKEVLSCSSRSPALNVIYPQLAYCYHFASLEKSIDLLLN